MRTISAYRKELVKYSKTRDELNEMLEKHNHLDEIYINIGGYIIPLNKIYQCTNLNGELNFEHIEWRVK